MKKIGLIGAGKWGQNYIKLANKLNIDLHIGTRLNWKDLINFNNLDGIIIATPPDSHIEIAIEALDKQIPVMIEKPLSLKYEEAIKLLKYTTPILVNNLHLFSPAYEYICNNIKKEDILEISSIGCNQGPYREYSCLFDYGPHDLSMGMYLLKQKPKLLSIKTLNLTTLSSQYELLVSYDDVKHKIVVGNFGPNKQRIFTIKTKQNNIIIYNDLLKDKLKYNNKIIDIDPISTLENSFLHFIKAIDGYIDDRFGVDLSISYVKFLEEIKT